MANEIKYSVGFDVKQSDLNKLKSSLQQLQKLSISDVMKFNDSDISSARKTLDSIRSDAGKVEEALEKAFNPKLNTVNIERFKSELNGLNVNQIYQSFSRAGAAGQAAFRNLSTQLLSTNIQLKQSHTLLNNIAVTLSNSLKWSLSSAAINTMTRSVQQAWGYVKNLDTSLNDIRIVTNKSADEMANFAVQANEAAKSLGRTTTDYTKAALIYAQQGLDDEEIAERTAITLKTANVTGQSASDVSEQLTAVWNGYKVNAEEAELYVDRLAAVAATTASDLEELSTGMSKVASAAAAMGVGEDQLAAQLSTIISVTRQAPETVGTALRTVYARISDIQAGIDEDGVTLGNYSGKMAELGFNVLDVSGHLRDMGEVMEEIGGRWADLTREQQVSLAQTMAGQRQYSNLIALFDNFEQYNKALNTAQNAAGTLQKQQSTYLDRTTAHLNQLKASVEDLYDSLINPDSLEPLIDALATVTSAAAKFVDSIGGGGNLLISLGAIGVSVFSRQIADSLQVTINNLDAAKQQAKAFEQILQEAKKQQQQGLGDEYTQFLNREQQSLLGMADFLPKDLFDGIQNSIKQLSQTSGDLDIVNEKIDILGKSFNATGLGINEVAARWGTLDDMLSSAEGVAKVQQQLQNFKDSYNSVIDKQEEVTSSFSNMIKNINNDSESFKGSFNLVKIESQELIYTLKNSKINNSDITLFDALPENAKQSVDKAAQELKNLKFQNFVDNQQAANAITAIFSNINQTISIEIKKIDDLMESAAKGQLADLEARRKQLEALLKQTEQQYDDLKAKAEKTINLQGITKVIGGVTQLTASVNQLKNVGQLIVDQDWGKVFTNSATSLAMMGRAAVSTGQAMKELQLVTSAATGGWIAFGVAAAAAVGFAIVEGIKAQNEALIQLKQTQIEEENKKQEQLQNNKKLYASIEDLNKQYSQGLITRTELKSTIEDLIDQYDLEGQAADRLRNNYENLKEAIIDARIADAEAGKKSAEREKASARTEVTAAAKSGQGRQRNNEYILELNVGFTDRDESEIIRQLLENAGGTRLAGGNIEFNIDFNTQSIVNLYDNLQQVVDEINKSIDKGELTEDQVLGSEYYKRITEWLNKMTDSVEHYKAALQDIQKYSAELASFTAIGTGSVDLQDIQTANEYLEQRAILIQEIQQLLDQQGNTTANAADMADAYLRENYRNLFVQYDEARRYIEQIREQFGSADSEVEQLISTLDDVSRNYLQDNFDLKDLSGWEELERIIKYLADPETVGRLQDLTTVQGSPLENAQSQYDLYSSLSSQISSSNTQTISKKEFESLDASVQQYFSFTAKGQYKLTGDAKKFYELVNNLSLKGFKDNIDTIVAKEQQLNKIIQSGDDYLANMRQSINSRNLTRDSEVFDLLAQQGQNVVPWITALESGDSLLRSSAFQSISEAFEKIEKQGINLTAQLQQLDKELYTNQYAIFSSADSIQQLKDLYADAQQTIAIFGEDSQQATVITQAFTAAMIDLNKSLDLASLDSDQLKTYAQYLQEIAETSDDLDDSLRSNAEAAEIVAKSIMKMNDGFDLLGKSWDDWLDVLQNSADSSEEFSIAMQGARDAVSQLLDISVDYVTNDFIKQHFDEITAASNGSTQAIDQLKQALAETIIQSAISQNALEGMADEIWTAFANIQAQIPDFEVGMELDDEPFLNDMQKLIDILELDVDQVNALFDSLGFEPTFVTTSMPITQEIPASQDVYEEVDRQQFDGTDSFNRQFTASFPIVKHYSKDTTQSIDGFVDVPALSTENGKTPQIKTITRKATSNFSNYAPRNAGGATSPKKQTKTKSSASKEDTSTKETKNPMQDDRDIYHDINIELAQIGRDLERVQKQQDRLYGKQLIENLNKQTEILEKQKTKLKEKLALQKLDLQNQKDVLATLGATFDEYGHISNYLDLLGSQQGIVNGTVASYNALVSQYNAITDKETKDALKDQLTEAERQVKAAEDDYKKLVSKLKDYDSLRDAMEDIVDQIDEETQKQIEINIKKFRMEVEIRLDMGDAERDWNKFRREVLESDNILKDSGFDTLFKDAQLNYNDIASYFDVHDSEGSIQKLTEQLNATRAEIEAIDQTGESAIYGDNKAQAMEDLQNDLNTLMSQMENIESLIQDIDQAYLNTIDDISDQFDKQIKDYEFVGELIQHDMDLLTLLYGDRNYDAMDSYYTTLHNNQLQQIDSLKQQREFWKDQWDEAVARGDTNAAQKFKENYMQAVKDINSAITQSVQTLQDKYTNAINKIFDTLDQRVTGGKGTDYLSMEWQLINKNADEYLDTINAAFAIQELEYKYQKAINDTDNVKNQQALTKLMNEQLDNLKAKDKLTQYDVDRAEKLLQVEQARLALEDTQNSKTSLRLKRDSQGNYSYVYTANEDEVSNAQEQLAKAQNDLYNFDKQAYQNNLDDMLSAWKDFQSKYKDIVLDTSLTEEERIEQLALLRQQYGEYINNKAAENEVIRENLMESAFADYAALYDGDYQAYVSMIDSEKQTLMGQLVPTWNSGIQEMTNTFVGEGGFLPACIQAFNDIDQATVDYERELDNLQEVAGEDFDLLKQGIDETAISFQGLIEDNDTLIERMRIEMDTIESLKRTLDGLIEKYQQVYNDAKAAAQATHDFLQGQNAQAADAAANVTYDTPAVEQRSQSLPSAPTITPIASTSTATASTPSTQTATSSESSQAKTKKAFPSGIDDIAEGIAGNVALYGVDSWGTAAQKSQIYNRMREVFGEAQGPALYSDVAYLLYDPDILYGVGGLGLLHNNDYYKSYDYYEYLKKLQKEQEEQRKKKYGAPAKNRVDMQFDTGGYTGEWGSDGKLAVLHEKEIVLNASDTKNMLDSVSILRKIISTLGGNISTKLSNLNGGFDRSMVSSNEQIEQNVHIDATFPNVDSKREIEEAFNDLVNLAAQRALR